jgi:hypothetical protein
MVVLLGVAARGQSVAARGQKTKKPPNAAPAVLRPDCTVVPGNLVSNCGFETGDFTSWTQSGDTSFTFVDSTCAQSGTFGACLGPINHPGLLTQSIPTTPGTSYLLTFWVRNSGRPAQFEVWWNGDRLSQVATVPDVDYTEFRFNVTATDASTDLTFAFTNVPSFINLDDITVAP